MIGAVCNMGAKDVSVKLQSSIQHPGQEKEVHLLETTGRYIKKAQTSYLKYEETTNGEKIDTTVKIMDGEALILRSGAVSMRLPFVKEHERPGTYGNGPAAFRLNVKTTALDFTDKDAGGEFNVNYELHADGALLGTYEITITYSEGTT